MIIGAAPWIVPFDRNRRFTGRDSVLSQLQDMLFEKDQTTKVAVWGLGGVGKTQLVLEAVYRIREEHKTCSVFWIPATSMESLQQAYSEIARQLEIAGWDDNKSDAKTLVKEYLSRQSAGQWVLVFDNADNSDTWIKSSENGPRPLIDYLPRSKQGCIIFTTRDRKTAVKLAHQNIVEVQSMTEKTAKDLLQNYLIKQDLLHIEQDTKSLLSQLTYLPLAIVQAAAYINENGMVLGDYLPLFREQEEEIVNLLCEEFEDDGRYHDVKNPVATTWLISFQQIQQRDPLAAEILSFIACVDPKDVPQSLLPPSPSRRKQTEAIRTLDAYSFITKHSEDEAFDVHRLVHLAMRGWLRKERVLPQWTEKAVLRLNDVFPDNDYRNRKIWRRYLTHAHYALDSDLIDYFGASRKSLAWKCALCLYDDGRFGEAKVVFAEILEMTKMVLGEEHPDTLSCINSLALTYSNLGRWKEAEKLEIQVMETTKRMLGAENPGTLSIMNNIASMYRDQGRWKEAEELGVQVLEIRKKVLGAEHPHTLTSMGNLAVTYLNQGRWKDAEKLEVEVMVLLRRALGAEHLDTLTSTRNLALTYSTQGQWKEAEKLVVQVIETRKRILGAEHPGTLSSIGNLVSAYQDQGRWKETEELEVQVLEIRKKVLSAEHPYTLTSMGNLASAYSNQGRWKEAEKLEAQVMKTMKRMLGAEHPGTLISMNNLASTYQDQGRWKDAEELFVQVIEARKRVLGAEHPHTLTTMANFASTYSSQGRWKEAEELEVQVLETSKQVLSVEHPDTLTSMGNLSLTYSNQGRWKEAEELEMQVLETRKRVLGVEHPNTLTSTANLASTYSNQGRWEEAEDLEVQGLEARKRVLGAEHPDTLSSMSNLAHTWKNQKRDFEALTLMRECIELRTRVLGPGHPKTVSCSAVFTSWREGKLLDMTTLQRFGIIS